MRRLGLTILALFVFGAIMPVYAGSKWVNYSYTNTVFAIERIGDFWWLATDGGLVKFNDSTKFIRIFNRGNSNIPSNHIKKLGIDENQNLWLATDVNGIARFDGTTFTNFNTANANILSDCIKLMDYEQNKGVWIVTDSALTFFDGAQWTHYRTDADGDSLKYISALYAASPYGLLLAVANKVEFLNHDGSFVNMNFTGSGLISGVGYDYMNNIVVSTYDNGFWVSNNGGWDHYNTGNTPMRTDRIVEMKIAADGDIYFNHEQSGLSVWHADNTWNIIPDKDGDPLNYLITIYAGTSQIALGLGWPYWGMVVGKHPSEWQYDFSDNFDLNRSPIHSNEVWNIVIKNGKKYIASRGIDILDNGDHLIRKYDHNNGSYFSLMNYTKYLAVDAWDNIWCADDLNVSLTKISGDRITVMNDDSLGIVHPEITGLQWETRKKPNGKIYGTLWVSVNGNDYGGLVYLDSLWHKFPDDHPQYPWGFKEFVRDASGVMWFADHNIYSYDGNVFTRYWDELPLKIVKCAVKDSSGNLWFGGYPDATYGWQGGLLKYSGKDWTFYSLQNSNLPDDHVNTLAVDTSGYVWVGTEYGGLVKINNDGTMAIFNRENTPLDNNAIVKIAVDPQTNNLWILNSNSGVFIYNEQGVTSIDRRHTSPPLPQSLILYANYPNPFNPITTIRFALTRAGHVTLNVYDINGRLVRVLSDGFKPAGEYRIRFDASNLASGLYFCLLRSGNQTRQLKMVLIK